MPMLAPLTGLAPRASAPLAASRRPCVLRLWPLGLLTSDLPSRLYGDLITAGQMSALGVPWGASTPTAVEPLLPGWQWEWDVRGRSLTVTKPDGSVSTRPAPTWSSLGVSLQALESHQFVYVLDPAKIGPGFLVARGAKGVCAAMPMLAPLAGFAPRAAADLSADSSIFPLRLLPLGSLMYPMPSRLYGDLITVGQMSALGVPWGTSTPTAVEPLLPGWQWEWDVRGRSLTVTKPDGSVATRPAPTWSSLGVSLQALESHQFVYVLGAGFSAGAGFPIAHLRAGVSDGEQGTYNRAYGVPLMAWHFRRKALADLMPETAVYLWYAGDAPTLLALWAAGTSASLIATGDFPMSLLPMGGQPVAWLLPREMSARVDDRGPLLFWRHPAADLFPDRRATCDNRPCYEPWMLWLMWKWLGGSKPAHGWQVFDLSPNWNREP